MKPDLSIIIVSYNTKQITLDTLDSIFKHAGKLSFEVIVVDNASKDGSGEAIQQMFPHVKLIAQKSNLGFGGANNLGAKHARAPYLAFINSDIIVNETTFEPLLTYLHENTACGIVAPKIYLTDKRTIQPGSFGPEPTIRAVLARSQSKHDKNLERFSTPQSVDWVTGAAFVMPKSIFEQIGGFDTNIFMYYEDQDLCKRVKEAGFEITWLPESTLVHLGGASTQSTWKRKKWYYAAQTYYNKKHYGELAATLFTVISAPYKFLVWVKSFLVK